MLCQLINTMKSNTIDVDYYRDRTPAERLQIAFFSIKEHLNINGPPAPVESIIEGREDDLLFLYLEKIKLFYCTSYAPAIHPKLYGSTKSLNRSLSLNAADNKCPLKEYRSQTPSPYPSPLYGNSSCTSLESIKEKSTSNKKMMYRNRRPHSYHELSTVSHLMSSSGARVISVETGSASEAEDESNIQDTSVRGDKCHPQVANSNDISSPSKISSNYSQLNNVVPKTATFNKSPLSTSPLHSPSDQNGIPSNSVSTLPSNSVPTLPTNNVPTLPSNNVLSDIKAHDNVEVKKHSGRTTGVTPTVIPTRHQRPPLPKAPPPPLPPSAGSVKRQIATQMTSTDGQSSLQTFLSLSQSKRDLENIATGAACEVCMETKAKIENVMKKERELTLYPLQRACKF